MARVIIGMPDEFPFATEMEVRIEHINRGNHVGNDCLITFLNEARIRLFPENILELSLDDTGMIVADLAVIYKSEAKYGEVLRIQIAPGDYHKHGFDLFYQVTEASSGRVIAHAKTAMLLFDFKKKRLPVFENGVEAYLKDLLAGV